MQAAGALQHAHETGVVHRDIKPANLLLDGRGKLWVTDFGLAQVQADRGLTMTGDLVGTLRYMSPEQALGRRELVDHRTDVYSLGVTLYEMLALCPAVEGGDREEILRQIAFAEPRPLRKHQPTLPVELETIALKAAAKEPRERYATARELADDLGRFLEHRPIRARRPTAWQHASKWAGRHQGVLLAALAGLVVALGTLAVSVWRIEREREDAVHHRDVAEENAREVGRREAELRLRLYPADINRAHRAWQTGNYVEAREVLRRQIPEPGQEDLRGFEWYFLSDRCQRGEPRTLGRHKKRVYDVVFSPDGKKLASASEDCTVGLWDVESGQLLGMLGGYTKEVDCVWFSPDSKVLASNCGDGTIHLWDVAARRRIKVLALEGAKVGLVHFRPDGSLTAAVHAEGFIEVWDPGTGKRSLLEGFVEKPRTGAFSRDGGQLAVGEEDGTVHRWDVATRKRLGAEKYGWCADTVGFGPCGRLAIAASSMTVQGDGSDDTFAFPFTGRASATAFSADGGRLAYGGRGDSDRILQVWDVNARMREETFRVPDEHVWGVAFSPDGTTLAIGSSAGEVRLHRLRQQRPEALLQCDLSGNFHLEPSPDGKHIAVRCDSPGGDVNKMVHLLLDRQTGKPHPAFSAIGPAGLGGPPFSPDGRWLTLTLWQQQRSKSLIWDRMTGSQQDDYEPTIVYGFAPDGTAFSWPFPDGEILFLDPASQRRVRRIRVLPTGQVLLTFTPDGRRLLGGYKGGEVRWWDARTGAGGQELFRAKGRMNHLPISPAGDLVAADNRDGTIQVWDLRRGCPLPSVACSSADIWGMAFAPDGKTLGVNVGGQVILFHVATGQELFALEKHHPHARVVAFSADGQSLITGLAPVRAAGKDAWRLIRWDAPRSQQPDKLP